MAFASRFSAIAGLTLTLSGCWTGQLIESARLHETVLTYERISLVGDELRVDYLAELTRDLSGNRIGPLATRLRAASFPIDALAHRPVHPVDDFPLRRIRPGSMSGTPLAIGGNRDVRQSSLVEMNSQSGGMVANLAESEGRHLGFGLCHVAGEGCVGFFHSGALYRDRISWWVYPVAPFAIALDLALLPIQLFTLPPLIALSD